jgi:hypothetical protein
MYWLDVKKCYIYAVKTKQEKSPKTNKELRQEILNSMIASFKIEGINISSDFAISTLKKLEVTLEK